MKLGYFEIIELGTYISNYLIEHNIKLENQLILNVDKTNLKKIDEDLYYRNNPEGDDFLPSDNEINVNFENLKIKIKTNEEN